MIPKLLHFIWVGDESRRPDALIQTWAAQHPGWDVKLWTNEDITRGAWRLRPRFYELGQRDCAALAAAMKWEILWREGGVVVSADSLCLAPLDESWLRHGLFTHWEHEQQHPGLIGCSFIGSEAGNPLIDHIVQLIENDAQLGSKTASDAVGAGRLTDACRETRYDGMLVLPSHHFHPRYPDAPSYRGPDKVHALELFGSKLGLLDVLKTIDPAVLAAQFEASAQPKAQEAGLVVQSFQTSQWQALFPNLDWHNEPKARAQALAQAAAALSDQQAWREVAELAASLQVTAAELAGTEPWMPLRAPATTAAPAPMAAPTQAPADTTAQKRVAEVKGQFAQLSACPNPRFALDWEDRWLCLDDNTTSTGFDRHYTFHPAWAARVLAQSRPQRHVDFSSSLNFVTLVSAFVDTDFYDVRPVDMGLSGLQCGKADLTALPMASHSLPSVSCMHVIEHVGLARYGDDLDYDGDLKAIRELQRVTAHGGQLLFVVPIGGRARIQFNAHRIYTHAQVCQLFEGWALQEFALIPDHPKDGNLISPATQAQADAQQYGCGCFWFVKP
jgi:hypothetical protein